MGIIGALVGGFLLSGLICFEHQRGINLASIMVAAVGVIVFLYRGSAAGEPRSKF